MYNVYFKRILTYVIKQVSDSIFLIDFMNTDIYHADYGANWS